MRLLAALGALGAKLPLGRPVRRHSVHCGAGKPSGREAQVVNLQFKGIIEEGRSYQLCLCADGFRGTGFHHIGVLASREAKLPWYPAHLVAGFVNWCIMLRRRIEGLASSSRCSGPESHLTSWRPPQLEPGGRLGRGNLASGPSGRLLGAARLPEMPACVKCFAQSYHCERGLHIIDASCLLRSSGQVAEGCVQLIEHKKAKCSQDLTSNDMRQATRRSGTWHSFRRSQRGF